MKEELQGKLLEILTAIQDNTGKAIDTGAKLAGQAGDFAMEQLPDIAQSYVAFARAWETFGALLWWTLFAASVYVFIVKVFMAKEWVDRYGDPFVGRIFLGVGSALTAVIAFIGAMTFTRDALFVWFAPKVWLIQELAKLIGTMKG